MEQRHVIGWVFVGRRVPRRGRLRERLEKRPEARAEHLPLTRPPRPLFPVTHHSPLQAQLPSFCDQPYGELIWREGGDPPLDSASCERRCGSSLDQHAGRAPVLLAAGTLQSLQLAALQTAQGVQIARRTEKHGGIVAKDRASLILATPCK